MGQVVLRGVLIWKVDHSSFQAPAVAQIYDPVAEQFVQGPSLYLLELWAAAYLPVAPTKQQHELLTRNSLSHL